MGVDNSEKSKMRVLNSLTMIFVFVTSVLAAGCSMPHVLRKSCNFFRKCCMVKYWRQSKIFRQDVDMVEDETYKEHERVIVEHEGTEKFWQAVMNYLKKLF